MMNKKLGKRIEFIPDEDAIESQNRLQLEYYLLESDDNSYYELNGNKFYGIEVAKAVGNNCYEIEQVKNFSCCKESTVDLIEKLARNSVTPVELPFVLDDMLGI